MSYTDASKKDETCRIAITEEDVVRIGHPKSKSVYQAEAIALFKALDIVKHKQPPEYLAICTDSLGTLQSIKNIYIQENIKMQNIQDLIHDLYISHICEVALISVPGHAGIEGNEIATKRPGMKKI